MTDRRRNGPVHWAPAILATVILHAAVVWSVRSLDIFGQTAAAHVPEPIEVVFTQPAVASPRLFTEQPPDRADAKPEEASLLSNVDSRARDRVPGGEDDHPQQTGRADYPQVAMEAGRESAPASDAQTAPVSETPVSDARTPPQSSARIHREDPWAAFRRPAAQAPQTKESPPTNESSPPMALSTPEGSPAAPGGGDLAQEAGLAPDANAAFPGDISLNTTAWDWAPWLLAFRRELMASWTAPLGYHLGLIHGWTLLEVVIAPDGTVRSSHVLDEEGNVAFREASVSAIERSKPYPPLPEDFPEDALILTIRMAYPEWRRR